MQFFACGLNVKRLVSKVHCIHTYKEIIYLISISKIRSALCKISGMNRCCILSFIRAKLVSMSTVIKLVKKVVLLIGHWLDMVYLPPPRGNFVDHIFLEAQCLAKILQHVSPLTMAALSCNSLLHTLPYKIFDN